MSTTLDRLPAEIKLNIASCLNQLDALSLSRTCKSMTEPCLQRVRQKVIVDACYTQFSKEYTPHYTYINSSYNLKKFLRHRGCKEIHALYVMSLPDQTNIYDAELHELMRTFFKELCGLHELVWLAENFTLQHLLSLPNRTLLRRLEININFSNSSAIGGEALRFENLRILQIRPFWNSQRLQKLLESFLEDGNGAEKLETLKLARFESDSPALVPSARELSTLDDIDQTQDDPAEPGTELDMHTLEVVFLQGHKGKYCNLRELSLNTVLVSRRDGRILVESGALHRLTRLSLKNVSEYGTSQPVDEGRSDTSFLGHIAPWLTSLQHLHLDFRETHNDTIADFLQHIGGLTSLDLVVRMNAFKKRHVNESRLYQAYGDAISQHTSLQKLSVEVRQEHFFCEITMPTPQVMLEGLGALGMLTSLRMSCVEAGATQDMMRLLGSLRRLQYFATFGINTGGAPNLGLGMVHPNVYDEWFRVQHFALDFWQVQSNLRYVRINDCVFECDAGAVHPRDIIDRWFESKVRV